MKNLTPFALSFLLVAALSSTAASAQIIVYDSSSATEGGAAYDTVGTLFQVGATNLTINQLGVQDVGGDSFTSDSSVDVGIWDTSGDLLASTTITNADALETGDYRYASVSALTLTAGAEYTIGALVGSETVPYIDAGNGPFSAGPDITLLDDVYAPGSFEDPTNDGGGAIGRWGPADAQFAAIPEPSAWVMIVAGVAILGCVRRFRSALTGTVPFRAWLAKWSTPGWLCSPAAPR
jgi:hypothetical protein